MADLHIPIAEEIRKTFGCLCRLLCLIVNPRNVEGEKDDREGKHYDKNAKRYD